MKNISKIAALTALFSIAGPLDAFAQENEPSRSAPDSPEPSAEAPASDAESGEAEAKPAADSAQGKASSQEVTALREELSALREEMSATRDLLAEEAARDEAQLEKMRAEQAKAEAESAETEAQALGPLQEGNFYLGGTFGATYRGKDGVPTLLGDVDDGKVFSTSVAGLFGRVLRSDNLALGMIVRFDHKSNRANLTPSETEPTQDRKLAEYTIVAGPSVRQFLPLMGKTLYVYYQAGLTGGYAERIQRVTTSTTSTVQSSNGYSLSVTVQPGVMIAASDNFAIEAGINLLGLDYTHYKTVTDYEHVGVEDIAKFNLDVNLLSLQFAFVGYF